MNFIERRFPLERRSGEDRRKSQNRQNDGRRGGKDRRLHCMHCGTPYEGGPQSSKSCVCRVTALRGPGVI